MVAYQYTSVAVTVGTWAKLPWDCRI